MRAGSYLSLQLLLRKPGSRDEVGAVPSGRVCDEICVLNKEGAQLEVGDFLRPLQATV